MAILYLFTIFASVTFKHTGNSDTLNHNYIGTLRVNLYVRQFTNYFYSQMLMSVQRRMAVVPTVAIISMAASTADATSASNS